MGRATGRTKMDRDTTRMTLAREYREVRIGHSVECGARRAGTDLEPRIKQDALSLLSVRKCALRA